MAVRYLLGWSSVTATGIIRPSEYMTVPFSVDDRCLSHIKDLKPYVPGIQPDGEGWIKLNTNENPYPPSPGVAADIYAETNHLARYPEPRSQSLRAALAQRHELADEQVMVGNGSDDILNLLIRIFCDKHHLAGITLPGYSLYPALAGIQGGLIAEVHFDRDMRLPIDKIAATEAGIFFITSPNAPTGVGFSREQIARLLERFKGILVVDEAYAEFARENAVGLLTDFPNLVITRSFSKSHSLAGLRVGYALASPEVIELLDRVRDSYNVSRLGQVGALAALSDPGYYQATLSWVIKTRDHCVAKWHKWNWFTYPTQANFIFTEPVNAAGDRGPAVAASLFEYLKKHKILVRYFGDSPLTESFLRISVGRDSQMNTFYETVESWLKTE